MVQTAPQSRFRPVVVAPTFNNAGTLIAILERIERLDLPMIVVNDGCTDVTADRLAQWTAEPRAVAVEVVTHETNRGKAAALQTGFARARDLGYTHAASIDTDGQLDPEDLPGLLALAEEEPRALVLGYRNAAQHNGPARSMIGRRVSNFALRLACDARVEDSQCGLRVYPLDLMAHVSCRGQRFAFETEIIARAAWAGCPIRQHPVSSRYFPPEQRVSHFRPFADSLRCGRVHARLLGRRLVPWPHRRLWDDDADDLARPWWRRLLEWIDPRRMWREVRRDAIGRWSFATALSLGTFVANLPIYGFQTLLSLYLARRLHLHPLLVVAGSHLSTPPIGPVLVIAAIVTGHFIIEGRWPEGLAPALEGQLTDLLVLPGHVLLAWLIGSVVVGLACMIVTFVGSLVLLQLLPTDNREDPASPGKATPGVTRQG